MKGKNYDVFYFTGKRNFFLYIYDVITSPEKEKSWSKYYSHIRMSYIHTQHTYQGGGLDQPVSRSKISAGRKTTKSLQRQDGMGGLVRTKHVHIHTYVYTYIHTHIYVYTYIHTHIRMCV